MSHIQSYNIMPSPRPTGSGTLKILLFPQLLQYHVFHFVAFSGNFIKPVLGFLLGVVGIHNCMCNLNKLFLIVIVMCLGESHLASTGLIPVVLGAIMRDALVDKYMSALSGSNGLKDYGP